MSEKNKEEIKTTRQPAGARELRCEMCGTAAQSTIGLTMRGPKCCQPCFTKYRGMTVKELMELFAAQQTAAKDAALQAAERERDSLREERDKALKFIQDLGDILLPKEAALMKALKRT